MKIDSQLQPDLRDNFQSNRRNFAFRRPMPSINEVRRRIAEAFGRSGISAQAINVVTEGSTVRLGGRVRVWREREMAVRAAWRRNGRNEHRRQHRDSVTRSAVTHSYNCEYRLPCER